MARDKYREALEALAVAGEPVLTRCDHCDAPVFADAGDAGGDRYYRGNLMAFPATCIVCDALCDGIPIASVWPYADVTP